jgi:two-component system, chemotaxis family, sensor kinase CheA
MSNPEEHPQFAAGFMDDYFAEADEHIVAVRRNLLMLEPAVGADLPPAILEDLFRSFHSLKGLSAMVELREAELLAHQMESCLRALRQGDVTLTGATFETLVDGANALEEVIVARRAARPLPLVDGFVQALEALVPANSAGGAGAQERRADTRPAATSHLTPTAKVWKVTFVPSPELVERGVKVDTIRTRLLQIGKVLAVAPTVLAGGGISFDFDVQTEDEQQLAAWREDGLTYAPLRVGTAAPEPSTDGGDGDTSLERSAAGRRPWDVAAAGRASFVRVDLGRLDELMRLVGDLVVTRARLDDALQRVERLVPSQEWRALQEHSAGIERHLRDLREGVMRVRLVPVGEIFRRMPFVVRDLARDNAKRVQLELAGQSTEIDKFLIERMMDPVLHLVRNAISHGIETPEERIAIGKSPEGTVRLSASTAGESVLIEISDDGAGIDVPAVAERARASGVAVAAGEAPDARLLLDIICASGFSTRDEADRASGRGVGMAVVRSTVQELGGTLALESEAGRGTTFTITLPLTLAIADAIIAHVGDHTFAVPQSTVREVIDVEVAALRSIERNELMVHRGGTLPMVRLAQLFGIRSEARPRLHAIVVGAGSSAVGLLVDRIAGQQEVVVKTITDPLIRVDGVSGATELGDGRLILILDVAALSRTLRERSGTGERVSA